ncbi:MAG: divalent cation tolerance protein CutA [Anaerolineae bacterium]|nr:divalent cation tolerance protein CutA [Anaerolineae bacterium]
MVVLTTVGSEDQGRAIAEALVEQEIAACVNILPGLRSIYRWKGKLWDDEELLLFIKTTDDAMDAVVATVRELHSYELPEILALSVERAETAVLDWLRSSVRAKPRDRSSD